MATEPSGVTAPQAGVIATRPATAAVAAPSAVGLPRWSPSAGAFTPPYPDLTEDDVPDVDRLRTWTQERSQNCLSPACALADEGGVPVVALGRERRVTLRGEAGNARPAADPGPERRVAVGNEILLDASASCDADGDALAAHWELISAPPGSAWSLTDPDSMEARLLADRPGPFRVRLVVVDAAGAESLPAELLVVAGDACEDGLDGDLDGLFEHHDPDCDEPDPRDRVAVRILGAPAYANRGALLAGDFRLWRSAGGEPASLAGSGAWTGADGRPARLFIEVHRLFAALPFWFGSVRLLDPALGPGEHVTPIWFGGLAAFGERSLLAQASWRRPGGVPYTLVFAVEDRR
jgi:hypothetical protein